MTAKDDNHGEYGQNDQDFHDSQIHHLIDSGTKGSKGLNSTHGSKRRSSS
jgi:hypothetical protein